MEAEKERDLVFSTDGFQERIFREVEDLESH